MDHKNDTLLEVPLPTKHGLFSAKFTSYLLCGIRIHILAEKLKSQKLSGTRTGKQAGTVDY